MTHPYDRPPLPIRKALWYMMRHGISVAIELHRECEIPILAALSNQWSVARLDTGETE